MWHLGKYNISTTDGELEVCGIISKTGFGIHFSENNRLSVTHLSSGMRVGGSLDAKYFHNAINLVGELKKIADWNKPFDNITREQKDKAAAEIRRLTSECLLK